MQTINTYFPSLHLVTRSTIKTTDLDAKPKSTNSAKIAHAEANERINRQLVNQIDKRTQRNNERKLKRNH